MVALFVVATIVLFVVADAIVLSLRRREADGSTADWAALEPMPAGLFLHPAHSWASVAPDGHVRVGLDPLARRILGPIDAVRLAERGARVKRGEPLLWVRAGESEVPIASPVGGVVADVARPPADARGNDPDAWLVALRPERLGSELRGLRVAEDAAAWLRAEGTRLGDVLRALRLEKAGALPDGGEPAPGLIRALDPAGRDAVLRAFLLRGG